MRSVCCSQLETNISKAWSNSPPRSLLRAIPSSQAKVFSFSMDDFRSKSCGDGRMQMESYGNMPPASGYDLRRMRMESYGNMPPTSGYDLRRMQMEGYGNMPPASGYDLRRMRMESYGNMPPTSGYDLRCYSTSYASSYPTQMPKEMKLKKGKPTGSSSKSWSFNDPELQRKKRVAGYKVYAVEGKMKGSFRKSFRWLKDRYTQVVYGWW